MATRRSSRKPVPERPHVDKARLCLMCGNKFRSGHVEERVCRCSKETAAWRSGNNVD